VKLKHPFILCTVPGALKVFRELGYKTFEPYIDESYDLIEDPEDRIRAIMDEVERLCNMTEAETVAWMNSVSEICDYNYEALRSLEYYPKVTIM
jgi:hypothetical protein